MLVEQTPSRSIFSIYRFLQYYFLFFLYDIFLIMENTIVEKILGCSLDSSNHIFYLY